MSLESSLSQTKPFVSLEQKTMVNIFFTHNWLSNLMKNFLKKYDLTGQQFNILRILRGANKPISTSIIRKRMIDNMSDTTRLINRMIKKSLVSKVTCPSDKRLVDIQISPIGLRLLEQIDNDINQVEKELQNLDTSELETLNTLLNKLRG